jgi:hypothetical protein
MKKVNWEELVIKPHNIIVAETSQLDHEMNRRMFLQYGYEEYIILEGGHCNACGVDTICDNEQLMAQNIAKTALELWGALENANKTILYLVGRTQSVNGPKLIRETLETINKLIGNK